MIHPSSKTHQQFGHVVSGNVLDCCGIGMWRCLHSPPKDGGSPVSTGSHFGIVRNNYPNAFHLYTALPFR